MTILSINVGTAIGYLDLDTSGFKKGFSSALQDLRVFQDQTAGVSTKLQGVGSALSSVGGSLTTGLTLPLVGAGTAIVSVGNQFESAMSRVKSIAGATEEEFQALKDQALDLGAKTSFSASEAAEGMENLASAGFTVSEIMDAMPGLLDLAASSGTDLATASEIAASAIRGFGLDASDSAHVADVFAEAAARTNAQTEDMGEAMKYIAPVAHAMGQSLEETAAAIGIMSDAGIKGSQAGTTLRGAFSRLASPTGEMKKKMEELSVSFYDAQGNMLPLNEIVSVLQDSFEGLTQQEQNNALITLFGQESLSGMLALIQRGPDELKALTESFEQVSGSASDMSDVMLDNTAGSMEELSGSIETLAIKFQEVLAPIIRSVVERLTEFVNWLSSLDKSTLETIAKVGMLVAALGPALLIIGKITSAVGSAIQMFSSIKTAMSGFSTVLSGLGVSTGPLLAIVAVIGVIVAVIKHLWDTSEEFRNSITESWNQITGKFSEFTQGIVDRLNDLGFNFKDITDVITTIWDNFCNLLAPILESAFSLIADLLGSALDVLTGIFDVFVGVFTGDWEQAWNGIKEIFGGIWDAITGIVTNAFDAIRGVTDEILGWFGTSWEQIGDQLGINLDDMKNQLSSWWDAVVKYNQEAWQDIPGTMQKNFDIGMKYLSDFGSDIVEKAKEYGEWFVQTNIDFFSQLPERLQEFFNMAIEAVKDWAINYITQSIKTGQEFIANIQKFFSELPQKLKAFFSQAIQAVKEWAISYITWSIQTSQDFIANVKKFFSELPTTLKNWFDQAIERVKQWATDMVNNAYKAMVDFKDTVVTTIQDLPNRIYEVGRDTVRGLWEGIQDTGAWIQRQISSFIDDIIAGVQENLGIASPSKVMASEVGHWMPLGIAEGFKSAIPQLVSTMQKSLNEGVNTLDTETTSTKLMSGVSSFSDGVKKVYSGLSDWIGGLNQKLIYSMDTMVQRLSELVSIQNSLSYQGVEDLYVSDKLKPKLSSTDTYSFGTPATYTFIYNSPEAISPVKAAKLMRQTSQQIAMGLS